MGDVRAELKELDDDDVIQALAAASTRAPSPYLANILASEALNRLRRARVVSEHIADGVFVLDARGRILSMNPAGVSMLGYEPRRLRGRDLSEICVDTGEPGHACVHHHVLDGGATVRDALDSFAHADGHVLSVSSTGAPIEHEGQVEGVIVAWRDVTADLRARRALEESEARYRSLFANSTDLVITIDREERIVAINPAGERLSGMTLADLKGKSLLALVPSHDRARARQLLMGALAGIAQQGEFELIRPDGSLLIYDAVAIPIKVGDEVVGVHGVARNITRLRRLEEGARVSVARNELIMAGVKDHAIILLGRTRTIESWNPGAERIFGWRAADVLGRPFSDLFPVTDPESASCPTTHLDEADRLGHVDAECDALRADGTAVFVSGVVNRVLDAHGDAHGYVVVLRDATPRRRAQIELRRALAVQDAFAAARDLLLEGVARAEEGRIVYANRALADLVGRARQELVGAPVASIFSGELGDVLPPSLREHPRTWTRARVRSAKGGDREVEVAMRRIDPVEGLPPDGWVMLVRTPQGGTPP